MIGIMAVAHVLVCGLYDRYTGSATCISVWL